MSTVFTQRWRKLYRHPSTSWQALPLSTRGLGDELVRAADDDGTIAVSKGAAAESIARLLQAHRDEYKRVAKDLERLLEDGFVILQGDRLRIRNFEIAQQVPLHAFDPSVPPANESENQESKEERQRRLHRDRQARYEQRQQASATPSGAPSEPDAPPDASTVRSDALPSQTLPSSEEEKRQEKKRQDETQSAQTRTRAALPSVTKQPPAPSLEDVLRVVAEQSGGRLTPILNGADTLSLKKIVGELHRTAGVDLHEWKVFGFWCCEGNPGFNTLKRSLTWQWLIGTDEARDGRRLFEAMSETRVWDRKENEKEQQEEARRAS